MSSDKTNAICIIAEMSFNTKLEDDFILPKRGVPVQTESRNGRPGGTPVSVS